MSDIDACMHGRRRSCRGARAVLAVAFASAATPACAGLEHERIAFETGAKAAQPSITLDPSHGFVVTWQERDGDASALRFALIDRDGGETRRGTVSSGKNRFVNGADFPSLAVLENGDWVTFWLEKTASGTYAYEIRTTRSRDAGRTWSAPLVVHRDATPTEHGFVSMTPAGADRVRLIWLDGRRMAATADAHGEGGDEHMTLRSAVLGRDGRPQDEHELDALTCACCQTDMARGSTSTLAVYRDRSDAEIRDVSVVAFDAAGPSPPRALHVDGWMMHGCPVNGPALAARGKRFLAVWPTMATGAMAVRAALGKGPVFDAPIALAEGADELGRVDAAAFGDTGWLVSRVATRERVPVLTLTLLSDSGARIDERTVASPVGGYPRLAVDGETALVVHTEPLSGGGSAIGVLRVRVAD